MIIRISTFLLFGCLLLFTQGALAQLKVNRKPSTQQKTSEQENAMQRLQEAMDPEALIKQLDQQLNLLKKQGMATPEMIREIEKTKEEIRQEFGSSSEDSEPANVPESVNVPSRPAELATTTEQEVAYDIQPNPSSEVPLFMRFYQESAMTASMFQEWMAQRYGVNLNFKDSLHQQKGLSYIHFEQVVDDFPVESTRFTFTQQSQSGAFATGMAYAPFSKKNESTLTLEQAFQKVKSLYPGQALRLSSQEIKDDFAAPISLGTCRALGKAWIAKTTENPQHEFWLCYRFYLVQTDEKIYVDAQSGEVLRREHTMLECLPTGPVGAEPGVGVAVRANTFFYGPQTITVLKKDTAYLLADPTEPKIAVFFKDTIQEKWRAFYDKTNAWSDAATQASGALDVHWAYRQTVNYYQSRFNWVGLGNSKDDISIMYKPDYPGAGYVPIEKRFEWGRFSSAAVDEMAASRGWLAGGRVDLIKGALGGDKPFASLDVCAHEFTHAVVWNMVGSMQRSGQPGALNEALADVMAAAVEAAVGPMGSNPWLIGEKILTGTGLRNLAKPKSSSTRTQPDTFEGDFWIETTPECNQENDRCGTHVNSGVIARWFYLICNGGMGTNDFDDKYSLKADEQVTTEEAAQLVFHTIPLLHPASDFEQFSDLTIEVAKNLFGKCSKKARAVEYAWYAVGVREDPPARCGDWTFDMVITADGEATTIHYYFKDDKMVIVPQADDNPGKMFSSLQSSLMTVVSRNDDGSVENQTIPKNIMKHTMEEFDEAMPAANEEVRQSIADDRRAIATETNPAERARMQRELDQKTAIWDKMQNQDLPALRQTMQEASSIPVMTESQFYGANSSKSRRKAKREFDKKYKQGTGKIEGFEAKHFAFEGQEWWSTYEIPLHLSDLIFTLPVSFQKNMGPAVDHFMRGFPLRVGREMKITNIKNKAPNNFEQLYSASPVFR